MWFTEDPWVPMLACGLVGLLFIARWASSKRVLSLVLALGAFLAGGLIYVVEQAIVTPAEEVERLTTQLCWEFQRKDPKVVDHFSATAPELGLMCRLGLKTIDIADDLRLTDFQTEVSNEGSRIVCHFRANATLKVAMAGNVGRQPARLKLTWAKEPDGWKIVKVQRLHPIKDEELEVLAPTSGL